MRRLSHSGPINPTVQALLERGTRRLARARLHFGHGTERARDDAAALLWHAMRLAQPAPPAVYRRRVSPRAQRMFEALLQRRIRERMPAVYLTQRCWFAGLPMYVDRRVLIPRSPIAELIERRFGPWIERARVRRILDLGTGSGCIAIGCARAFPRARVDAADISEDALAVARINIRRHRLSARVRAVQSDHFAGLGGASYDIIVSNPPYVAQRQLEGLPAEYGHEPRLALAAGTDGLDSVRVILRNAAAHLNPGGILLVEVGDAEKALRRAFPRLPFTWLAFERGGGGVFVLERGQLQQRK
ncbi:MAG TPA: 50S ribosomal protein L3 N(5)-glutamine methyltransferase [Steroidobacteraceae bacterium]|jgi:ribosomal protein L3 glutamine methyltransferase